MIVTHKRRSEPDLLPAKRDQNLHERKHDPNDSERDHVDPPGAVGMVFGSASAYPCRSSIQGRTHKLYNLLR